MAKAVKSASGEYEPEAQYSVDLLRTVKIPGTEQVMRPDQDVIIKGSMLTVLTGLSENDGAFADIHKVEEGSDAAENAG